MDKEKKIVSVFGSSRPREGDADYEQARGLGRALAECGFAVCTGGYSGVMEAVSRGAKEGGGYTIAVTTKFFRSKTNAWVDEERGVGSWQERLFGLIQHGDGYVACNGGTGTLAEFAVVWEMLNKGVISGKPFVVLGGFWLPVLEQVRGVELDGGQRSGESDRRVVHAVPTYTEAAAFLARALSADGH